MKKEDFLQRIKEKGKIYVQLFFVEINKEKDEYDYSCRVIFHPSLKQSIDSAFHINLDATYISIPLVFFLRVTTYIKLRRRVNSSNQVGEFLSEQLSSEKKAISSQLLSFLYFSGLENILFDLKEKYKEGNIENIYISVGSNSVDVLNLPWAMALPDLNKLLEVKVQSQFPLIYSSNFYFTEQRDISRDKNLQLGFFKGDLIKILFISALPENLASNEKRLGLERERKVIQQAILEKKIGNNYSTHINWLDTATFEEIQNILENEYFNIIHISGHGNYSDLFKEGFLFMEDTHGNVDYISSEKLSELIRLNKIPDLIYISACESGQFGEGGIIIDLLKSGVPYVIGMRYPIEDAAATVFSESFYKNLVSSKSIVEAFNIARFDLYRHESKLWNIKNSPYANFDNWLSPVLCTNNFEKESFFNDQYSSKGESQYRLKTSDRNFDFIGREKYLRLLDSFMNLDSSICIVGQGGIGKTTLLKEYLLNKYSIGWNQLWFTDFEINEQRILNSLKVILDSESNDEWNHESFSQANPNEQIRSLLKSLNGKYIIILDGFSNAEESYLFESNESRLKFISFVNSMLKTIAPQKNIDLFITTRMKNEELHGVNFAYVGPFSQSESVRYFNLFEEFNELSFEEKKLCISSLGGHPRAYQLLRALFKQNIKNGFDIRQFISKIQSEVANDLLVGILYDLLDEKERSLLKILSISIFPSSIDLLVYSLEEDEKTLKIYLNSLLSYSLCEINEQGLFYVHGLTSKWVLDNKIHVSEKTKFHRKFGLYYFEKSDLKASSLFKARKYFSLSEDFDLFIEVTFKLEFEYRKIGLYNLAFNVLEELKLQCKDLDGFNLGVLYHKLGTLYDNFGNIEKTKESYEMALEIFYSINNEKGIMASSSNFSVFLSKLGSFHESIDLNKRALLALGDRNDKLSKKYQSIYHANIGVAFRNLGELNSSMYEFKKSLYFEEEIKDFDGIAETLYSLGMLHFNMGELDEAFYKAESVLRLLSSKKIDNLLLKASCFHLIGIIYQGRKEYEKGLIFLTKSLDLEKKMENLRGIADSLHQIGILFYDQKDYNAAESYLNRALKLFVKLDYLVGKIDAYYDLGKVYLGKKIFRKAVEYFANGLKFLALIPKSKDRRFYQVLSKVPASCDKNDWINLLEEFNLKSQTDFI